MREHIPDEVKSTDAIAPNRNNLRIPLPEKSFAEPGTYPEDEDLEANFDR